MFAGAFGGIGYHECFQEPRKLLFVFDIGQVHLVAGLEGQPPDFVRGWREIHDLFRHTFLSGCSLHPLLVNEKPSSAVPEQAAAWTACQDHLEWVSA